MAGALDGRVALVTGSSRGIGRATALELASHGASVAVNYVQNQEKAEEAVREIGVLGAKSIVVQADVSKPEEVAQMVQHIAGELGPVTILVNNAGTTRDRTLRRMSNEEWETVMRTNVDGVFYCTNQVIQGMADAGGGDIVCLSSVVGETGRIGLGNYGTSKAAILGFVKSAARELARYNIRVNAVAPGFIQTDMIANLPDNVRDDLLGTTPLGRFGTPEEVARVVRFLVAEGSYITGATIDINGGLHM